jgi:hypothetical protein
MQESVGKNYERKAVAPERRRAGPLAPSGTRLLEGGALCVVRQTISSSVSGG